MLVRMYVHTQCIHHAIHVRTTRMHMHLCVCLCAHVTVYMCMFLCVCLFVLCVLLLSQPQLVRIALAPAVQPVLQW